MRILSIVVTLPMVWTMIFPQTALAQEIADTKTEIKFASEKVSLNSKPNPPFFHEGYVPVKTPEEIKNEKILNRWREKQKGMKVPEGKFVINASAYTAAADECGKSDGITSSGIKVQESRTLACPPNFPFGTKIKIEGMGVRVCEDRGGAIKGNHIDIYMVTKKEAFAFGRRNLMAEVVN
jgi:3D (Asp-Asp-Asp) domain-containing protein